MPSETVAIIPTKVRKPRTVVAKDPNLVALTKAVKLLETLDDAGKLFVLNYISEKYNTVD
jgi:hypothetical protein